MNTKEKLKEILMQLLTKTIEQKTEPAGNMSWVIDDNVVQGYDSELEKIAHAMVKKAESGDPKAVASIIEYVGDVEWAK